MHAAWIRWWFSDVLISLFCSACCFSLSLPQTHPHRRSVACVVGISLSVAAWPRGPAALDRGRASTREAQTLERVASHRAMHPPHIRFPALFPLLCSLRRTLRTPSSGPSPLSPPPSAPIRLSPSILHLSSAGACRPPMSNPNQREGDQQAAWHSSAPVSPAMRTPLEC